MGSIIVYHRDWLITAGKGTLLRRFAHLVERVLSSDKTPHVATGSVNEMVIPSSGLPAIQI